MFGRLKSYFRFVDFQETEVKNSTYVLLMAIAYIFSLFVRSVWFGLYGGSEVFIYNGQFIISSPDGWFWGKGAKDALAGVVGIADENGIFSALPKVAAVFAFLLPSVSVESVMFYMPAFIVSLSVIPVVLIGRLFSQPILGFAAALFVVTMPGFYARTALGYFDDDLLTLQMPLWILFFALSSLKNKDRFSVVGLGVATLMYQWWYPKSFSFLAATALCLALYTILFERKEFKNYIAFCAMLLGLVGIPMWGRFLLFVALYFGFTKIILFDLRSKIIFFLSCLTLFAMFGGFEPMMGPWRMYIFRTATDAGNELSLYYFTSLKTVAESMSKPFSELIIEYAARREIFWLSVVSYVGLIIWRPYFLMTLPFVFIGFLAIDGGSRFVPYANIAISLSLGFTTLFLYILGSKYKKWLGLIVSLVFVCFLSYFIFDKSKYLNPPSAMTINEVKEYEAVKQKTSGKGVAFGWWDYGYPIQFYTGLETISDGGRQGGQMSFVESLALTTPSQQLSSNLLKVVTGSGSFEKAYKNSGLQDPYQFFSYLMNGEVKASKDAYLVLPTRLLNIYATIERFSNVDLRTGKAFGTRVFSFTQSFTEDDNKITAGNGLYIDKKNWAIKDSAGTNIPLRSITVTNEIGDIAQKQVINNPAKLKDDEYALYAIINQTMGYVIICDEAMYRSTAIQLMVFMEHDERYFDKVYISPFMKVYKAKR